VHQHILHQIKWAREQTCREFLFDIFVYDGVKVGHLPCLKVSENLYLRSFRRWMDDMMCYL